jgi:hypothetical protein
MDEKPQTHPASLCRHPHPHPLGSTLWNVRKMDGVCVFSFGVAHDVAVSAKDAINEHWNWAMDGAYDAVIKASEHLK